MSSTPREDASPTGSNTGGTSGSTLGGAGEHRVVAALAARFTQGEHVYVGPGDDAAVLRTPRGHVVVSTDVLVEGRHFRREWAPPRAIGRKAAAANLSDVNAMGGRAHSLVVGLVAPPELATSWIEELSDGIAEEAELVGASIVGGDLTAGSEVVVSVTVLGTCDQAPVLRSGAQVGDRVALAGRQGWAGAGLAVLTRGFRSPRALVEAYQRPEPPYAAGPAGAAAGATSMIDVSDGLLADLAHLARASGVHLDVRTDAFELAEPMRAVGAALGVDPMQFVLGGGEDHAIAATFPPGAALPEGFVEIGSATPAGPSGPAVSVDGAAYDGPTGWDHYATT